MTAKLLDGKILAASLKESLKNEIEALKKSTGKTPKLKNIMIGNDPSADAYANSQKKGAEALGIHYALVNLPPDISQKDVIRHIQEINRDSTVHGIMIYKPVPSQIDYSEIMNCVDPLKDVEGMNYANLGKLLVGDTKIFPCTPAAAMEHIKSTGVKLRGKEAVIVGRSEIVGKPLSLLLLQESATVTICHSGTSDAGALSTHLKRADIVVAAMGKPGFIKGEWIKKGAIVIDVGINKVNDKITGDVEFDAASQNAAFITPVPGGVGPVTVVMLMRNALEAFKYQLKVN